MYRRAKHAAIRWARTWLFELAAAQIAVGLALWAVAYLVSPGEPPIILAMSALALVWSGLSTMAVAAIDEENGNGDT